jgi:hypothetical protein
MRRIGYLACFVFVTLTATLHGEAASVRGGSLVLRAEQRGEGVQVVLTDTAGVEYARGAAVYEMELAGGARSAGSTVVSGSAQLTAARLPAGSIDRQDAGPTRTRGISITVEGLPLEVVHEFLPRPAGDGLVERIRVTNRTSAPVRLKDYHFALQRSGDARGRLRAVAVPFRRQADGRLRDWPLDEIAAGKVGNSDWSQPIVEFPEVIDTARGRLRSEGWVLTDGHTGLLVAKYNPEQIEYSTLAWRGGEQPALRLGGSSFVLYREPEAMQRLAPGQTVRLGETFYFGITGDWPAGYERFRQLLGEMGHGLSPEYRPPINWNELFDVGWYHSDPAGLAKHYTRDALLGEARKAAEVGATSLYLDPGWEVCEGTTLWDAARLGPAADMVRTLRAQFGLDLCFRTIGRVYRDEFPHAWYMRRTAEAKEYQRPCEDRSGQVEQVPTVGPRGERNLALLPAARAKASSCLPGYAVHQVAHLNDGGYGNAASWVSDGEPSWAEIDLGAAYTIGRVQFGSEHTPWYHDRTPVHVRLLTATEYAEDSRDRRWRQAAENIAQPISGTREFTFAPRPARWVRVEILTSAGGKARIDEIEIYEAEAHPWAAPPRRRPAEDGCKPIAFWEVCTQCPAWQREKADRIERVATAGMCFAMFDEFDWRGPCYAADHGHAVPSTSLGHVRAVYELIRETKRRAPGLLVEAHDPVWPWGVRYLPVYFGQTLDPARRPGSYDENWGFEFMWNPIEDLVSGRALCLYYYNLGTDIPLYDHITAEKDNDACLAFWWYASTVRHLGIGGKKGLDSAKENPSRWTAYTKAMAQYRRLHEWFARGRFVGIDELTHLHVLAGKPGGVLVAFNLKETPVERQIVLNAAELGLRAGEEAPIKGGGCRSERVGDELRLTLSIPARAPLVVEIGAAAAAPATQPDARR